VVVGVQAGSGARRQVIIKMNFHINYHNGSVPVKAENYYLFLKMAGLTRLPADDILPIWRSVGVTQLCSG
jgi:hypothetical protein